LDVAQRDPSIQRRGDERVTQRVRADFLDDPGSVCDPADDPTGAMPVQPPPVRRNEDRSVSAFTGGQVDRSGGARRERDGGDLAALAGDGQGPVPTFRAQLLDVGAGGFGYPQPVQGQQGDQRVLEWRAEPGRNEHGAELVAV
jgi:hypothetical protein